MFCAKNVLSCLGAPGSPAEAVTLALSLCRASDSLACQPQLMQQKKEKEKDTSNFSLLSLNLLLSHQKFCTELERVFKAEHMIFNSFCASCASFLGSAGGSGGC